MSLVYIAGYITRKDPELTENQLLEQSTFYYQKYGKFIASLDRGGLNIPSDGCCQWTIFSFYFANGRYFPFILFNTIKEKYVENH